MKKNAEKTIANQSAEVIEITNSNVEETKTEKTYTRESNTVELCGYVGFTPQIHEFANGKKKIKFKIATHSNNKNGENKQITKWFPIAAWDDTAEDALSWIKKGDKIKIKGYLSYYSWKDKDGNYRNAFETVATELKAIAA